MVKFHHPIPFGECLDFATSQARFELSVREMAVVSFEMRNPPGNCQPGNGTGQCIHRRKLGDLSQITYKIMQRNATILSYPVPERKNLKSQPWRLGKLMELKKKVDRLAMGLKDKNLYCSQYETANFAKSFKTPTAFLQPTGLFRGQ